MISHIRLLIGYRKNNSFYYVFMFSSRKMPTIDLWMTTMFNVSKKSSIYAHVLRTTLFSGHHWANIMHIFTGSWYIFLTSCHLELYYITKIIFHCVFKNSYKWRFKDSHFLFTFRICMLWNLDSFRRNRVGTYF